MAKMEKVNISEWMINSKRANPACSYCFYNTDCDACRSLNMLNVSTTISYASSIWIVIMMIRIKEAEKAEAEGADVIDDVHALLEGEDNGKEKIDEEGNREEVREQPKKDKNETDVGRK